MNNVVKIQQILKELLPAKIAVIKYSKPLGGFLLVCKPGINVLEILRVLRDTGTLQARALMDVWASDYPQEINRFQVNYSLLSVTLALRFVIRVVLKSDTPIATAVPLFPAASWLEREVWDMFGVFFKGHPDLRRILTDYGFDGFPLRKDFPLSGYSEVRYDDESKRVVMEPVQITQEYRYFDFLSPWETK